MRVLRSENGGNELFQIEREENQNCQFATVPNDAGSLLGQHVALRERGVR